MSRNRAFTIIEVLVALTVLITLMFVPLSIASNYLIRNEITKESVNAQLLAQEMIEFIRKKRDSNILDEGDINFFQTLETDGELKNCFVNYLDWSTDPDKRDRTRYCIPKLDEDGFVGGFKKDRGDSLRGTNKETCDGEDPKPNNKPSPTLSIVASVEFGAKYALLSSCVSWETVNSKPGNKIIRKVELNEVIYEWIVQTDS